jgi:hypothetical protein
VGMQTPTAQESHRVLVPSSQLIEAYRTVPEKVAARHTARFPTCTKVRCFPQSRKHQEQSPLPRTDHALALHPACHEAGASKHQIRKLEALSTVAMEDGAAPPLGFERVPTPTP